MWTNWAARSWAQHWQLIYCHKPHVLPPAFFSLTTFYFFFWAFLSLVELDDLCDWHFDFDHHNPDTRIPQMSKIILIFAINGEQLKKEDKDICLQLSLLRLMSDLSYFKRGAFCEYLRNWLLVYLLTILYLKHNSKNTSIIHLLTKQ